MGEIAEKVLEITLKLKWYGHMVRSDEHYIWRRAMEMKAQRRRKRRRYNRIWLDRVKGDIKEKGTVGGGSVRPCYMAA